MRKHWSVDQDRSKRASECRQLHLSLAQYLVLLAVLMAAVGIMLLGWSIRRMDKIQVQAVPWSAMDLIKNFPPSALEVSIKNPGMIPFSLDPFCLEIKTVEGSTLVSLSSRTKQRVKILGDTKIQLRMEYGRDFKLKNWLGAVSGTTYIEGNVTARVLWFRHNIKIREEYELSQMLKKHR